MVNFCDVCTHDVIQVFHAKTLPSHYRETSNISQTPVGNNLIDRSDVVGASSIRAVPTTSQQRLKVHIYYTSVAWHQKQMNYTLTILWIYDAMRKPIRPKAAQGGEWGLLQEMTP